MHPGWSAADGVYGGEADTADGGGVGDGVDEVDEAGDAEEAGGASVEDDAGAGGGGVGVADGVDEVDEVGDAEEAGSASDEDDDAGASVDSSTDSLGLMIEEFDNSFSSLPMDPIELITID